MEGGLWGLASPLYPSRENGRISENATRAPTGGEAAKESQPTSSFIFINTCKFQEPFSIQGHPVEPTALLEASFLGTGGSLQMPWG